MKALRTGHRETKRLDRETWRSYLSDMSRRYTDVQIAEAEKQDWLQAKARGRNRFIWRRGVLPTFLFWLILMPAIELLGDHRSPFSLQTAVFIGSILLPICLLGGYLEGRWKWQDLERKYPE